MDAGSRAALPATLCGLMTIQAGTGLLWPGLYRDVEWIRATWFGNDLVTLAVALPLLVAGTSRMGRSWRARLLVLGLFGYGVYNYAFYMLGATLNRGFGLYVAALLVSSAGVFVGLRHEPPAVGTSRPMASRATGGYFALVGFVLCVIWLGTWAAYAFTGRPTPVEPEVFKVVAALDLSLMVPGLVAGGVLLWRRHPWGLRVSALAGVQAALYLLVLTVNSAVAIERGLATWPGELPTWAPLCGATTLVTGLLFLTARPGTGADRP